MDRRKINMRFDGRRTSPRAMQVYLQHLHRIENQSKKVDNDSPPFPSAKYYDPTMFQGDASRLADIECQNRQLLKCINVIYRTHGKVDSSNPSVLRSTNYYTRAMQNKMIEKENKNIYRMIQSAKSCYSKRYMEKEFEQYIKVMIFSATHPEYYEKNVPMLLTWDICPNSYEERIKCNPFMRVKCFFDIAIDDPKIDKRIKLGRMYMEIYKDYAPIAAENFINFVRGCNGLSYKDSQFFRIEKGVGCVGGDVRNKNGSGYYSPDGKCFPDENHLLKFNGPGVISTFTLFPNHNHTHFFISFQKLESLNGRFVVFGRVIKCLTVLERIEECGTKSGSAKANVLIDKCGVICHRPDETHPPDPCCKCNHNEDEAEEIRAQKAEQEPLLSNAITNQLKQNKEKKLSPSIVLIEQDKF